MWKKFSKFQKYKIESEPSGIIQQICYYYSKYLLKKENYLETKIINNWKLLSGEVYFPTWLDIEQYVLNNNIDILESSRTFFTLLYKNVRKDALFKEVRNKVFLENQGLTYEESIL